MSAFARILNTYGEDVLVDASAVRVLRTTRNDKTAIAVEGYGEVFTPWSFKRVQAALDKALQDQ